MSYPTRPDALTREWLSRALDCTVRDFEVQLFGEGAGIMGQVTRVKLDCDRDLETIIAKFPSPAEENRAVARTYDMYGREVRFYQNIAPLLPLRTPACYFAAHTPETQDFIILMEDIRDHRIGDQVAGCTLDEAVAVIETIAAMHAATWKQTDRLGLISHNNPAQRDGMIGGFQFGWPVVMEKFRDVIPDSALIAESGMPAATPWLLNEMCSAPVCLNHVDMRLDNIFFGNDVLFVDWQSTAASCPEHDLAYFVTQSVPIDVRHSYDLVDHYYKAFRAHGIDYPRELFDRRYKVSALYLLDFAVVIAGTLNLANERGHKLGRTLLGGAMSALDELNAFELLK
ncbi:MAG: phosphotransferase [Pseudomonadales bacterium]|nr:phosphotransferase [Pseudomonadales bacterium]MCP5182985.1 phosphotransferase [Pseudomonadales bacterium]